MTFRLVLDDTQGAGEKDVGDNVFLANLPSEYPCYCFYFPGAMPDFDLEAALRAVGEEAGQNLFVNVGRLNDPNYGKMAKLFEIRSHPVIVLTAIATLASPATAKLNTYVRLDSAKLLNSPERTVQCVQRVYNLFLRGEVAKAIADAKWTQRIELASFVGQFFIKALQGLWDFISERDISFSVAEGKFELKKSESR
jgi:hypothetical protein